MIGRNLMGHLVGGTFLATTVLLGGSGTALAEDKPVPPPATQAQAQEIKDQRALKLLKEMSDTLAGARTLQFKARALLPLESPTGQYISLFAASRVRLQRPDRLFVESRGDLVPNDLYYNGKTVTAIGPARKFYAQQEAAGSTLDAVLQQEHPGADTLAPFVDLLVSDPYARLSKDLASALLVGQSTIAGVTTDHLAFTAPGVDWELWIGAQDKLPRLAVASYRSGERQPVFTVEFSDWKLNAPLPAQTFEVRIPKDAIKLEFKRTGLPQAQADAQGGKQ
ncbi:DUF2092 domain-containing protein [Accumulibacter sp.]|uniref:DUF2092 domain-containing protein n=1 Tax=Accumulibacter sp. TaxID=2053492 RepID=UPI002B5D9D58|nr:DUF2092 domain-containing protein [Accumulibacter sp.]HRF06581.1 DUF2092 domain-containing protein [Accumulibacter sp.]